MIFLSTKLIQHFIKYISPNVAIKKGDIIPREKIKRRHKGGGEYIRGENGSICPSYQKKENGSIWMAFLAELLGRDFFFNFFER